MGNLQSENGMNVNGVKNSVDNVLSGGAMTQGGAKANSTFNNTLWWSAGTPTTTVPNINNTIFNTKTEINKMLTGDSNGQGTVSLLGYAPATGSTVYARQDTIPAAYVSSLNSTLAEANGAAANAASYASTASTYSTSSLDYADKSKGFMDQANTYAGQALAHKNAAATSASSITNSMNIINTQGSKLNSIYLSPQFIAENSTYPVMTPKYLNYFSNAPIANTDGVTVTASNKLATMSDLSAAVADLTTKISACAKTGTDIDSFYYKSPEEVSYQMNIKKIGKLLVVSAWTTTIPSGGMFTMFFGGLGADYLNANYAVALTAAHETALETAGAPVFTLINGTKTVSSFKIKNQSTWAMQCNIVITGTAAKEGV